MPRRIFQPAQAAYVSPKAIRSVAATCPRADSTQASESSVAPATAPMPPIATDDATCPIPQAAVTATVRCNDHCRARPKAINGSEWSTPRSVWATATVAVVPSSTDVALSSNWSILG